MEYLILTIFLIILSLSIVFIISASAFNSSLLGILGYTFLFLLGVSLLNVGLTYYEGSTSNETYFYDATVLNSTTVYEVPLTTTWNDTTTHLIGWLFGVSGFLGFVLVLFNLNGDDFRFKRIGGLR